MSRKEGKITQAGFYPSEGGFLCDGDIIAKVLEGTAASTSVAATLEVACNGEWSLVPDANGLSTITAAAARPFTMAEGDRVRLNVTAVNGDWNYSLANRYPR